MEQNEILKALADHLKIEDVSKLTNAKLSDRLKKMELDGTGNKGTLSGRLYEALKLGVTLDTAGFPTSPVMGQEFTHADGKDYVYKGVDDLWKKAKKKKKVKTADPETKAKAEALAALDKLGDKRTDADNDKRDELRKELLGLDPEPKSKPADGMKATAGFYAKYTAGRTNAPNEESPLYDFTKLTYRRTLSLPHAQAKLLNSQKENSGDIYKQVDTKTSK